MPYDFDGDAALLSQFALTSETREPSAGATLTRGGSPVRALVAARRFQRQQQSLGPDDAPFGRNKPFSELVSQNQPAFDGWADLFTQGSDVGSRFRPPPPAPAPVPAGAPPGPAAAEPAGKEAKP